MPRRSERRVNPAAGGGAGRRDSRIRRIPPTCPAAPFAVQQSLVAERAELNDRAASRPAARFAQPSSAATPGRVLPSSHSRKAPPAAET
jgi:hypothetical protein